MNDEPAVDINVTVVDRNSRNLIFCFADFVDFSPRGRKPSYSKGQRLEACVK